MEDLEYQIVNEPLEKYKTGADLIYKDECFAILGACFEVHNNLGRGFLEVVYKDALEIEFKLRGIPYQREKKFVVEYKEHVLEHFFVADFVIYDKIILEVKSRRYVVEENYDQSINYLAITKCKLALLVNFGEKSLKYKRLVL